MSDLYCTSGFHVPKQRLEGEGVDLVPPWQLVSHGKHINSKSLLQSTMYDWNLVRDMRRELEQLASQRLPYALFIYSINLLSQVTKEHINSRALVHMVGSKVTFAIGKYIFKI